MAGERRFTRIPPESTGDRVWMVHTAELGFEAQNDANYQWKIGQRYQISGNGGPTMSVHLHGVYDAGTTGLISVHYSKSDKFGNISPIAGQTLTDPDGVTTVATLTSEIYDLYIPGQNIVGYDNPEYGMDVDITGSANVRFAEGLPQLDAWGKLRTSGATPLGEYVFGQEAILTDNFSTVELEGGYVTYDSDRNSVKIGIDNTVGTVADAFAGNTTNTYHRYIPGSSHLYAGTALLNDPNATGSVRRWGMFDANNGFFFLVGTGGFTATDATGFGVCIRSSIPSAPQKDTIIPRSDWNGDKLDGTGDSQEAIDLTQVNIWWIDVQWHGAGRVRFGTYVDGQRVVCHQYYQGNNYAQAMSQTASLPVCYSNKSTASTASNLFIETWSAAIWTENNVDLNLFGAPSTYASTHFPVTADVTDPWQYLFSLSPEELLPNGEVNHSLYIPTSISAYAFDVGGGPTGPIDAIIDLKAEINSIHADHSFSLISGTTLEISTAGTSYESGKVVLNEMFRGRYVAELTDTYNNFQYGSVKNFSEDGGTKENTITGITEAATAEITVSGRLNLREPMAVTFPLNTNSYNGAVEITGSTNTSYNGTFYLKPTGVSTAELYTGLNPDGTIDLATAVDSSAFGAFTGTATVKGFQGSRVIWSFFAKTRDAIHGATPNVRLMVTVNWKELVQ